MSCMLICTTLTCTIRRRKSDCENYVRLVDLAILVDAFGSDIDWTDVEFSFFQVPMVMRTFWPAINWRTWRCCSIDAFRLISVTSKPSQRAPARECIIVAPPADKSQDTAGAIAAEYWKRLRRRPALAINLIDPCLWPERVRAACAKSPEAKLSPTRTCKASRPPSNAAVGQGPKRGCTLAKAFRLQFRCTEVLTV